MVLICAAVLLSAAPRALAQGEKPKPTPASKVEQQAPAMDPMMAKYMELAQPGPGHELLKTMVGAWDAKTKFWMAPGEPPTEGTGVMTNTLILDGRFLREEFTGAEFMGIPFTGLGYFGFDNFKKKYVSTWMDSMGTGVMVGYGTYDAATKTFTTVMEADDPMTGGKYISRHTARIIDKDHMVADMHRKMPDGKEIKEGEIHYTRRAGK
jgi:hypothetical protein